MVLEINQSSVLRDCRSANLRQLEGRGRTVLHLGVSDGAHFERFAELTGAPARQIAVRARGADVPEVAGVEWASIAEDGTIDVGSGSVDIIWADDIAEQLWPETVPTFLDEMRRLLSPRGVLVMTGCNREVAAGVERPVRAVELTWAELVGMLGAAGFDITRPKGMLLARDGRGDPLVSPPDELARGLDFVTRAVAGRDAPERSLAWWVEAQSAQRPVETERVEAFLRHATRATSQTHLETTAGPDAVAGIDAAGVAYWEARPGESGLLGESRVLPLRRGRYRATVFLQRAGRAAARASEGSIEVLVGRMGTVIGQAAFRSSALSQTAWTPIELEFQLDHPVDDFRLQITATGVSPLRLGRKFALSSLFWTPPMDAA